MVSTSSLDRPDEPATPDAGGGGLVRARLDLGYDGTSFRGWAAQPGLRTVEAALSGALATVLRLPAPPRLVVAGRTDAGVHAVGQVCHVDLPAPAWAAVRGRTNRTPERALLLRLTGVLPPDLRVHGAAAAPPGFEARFSAMRRHYAYRVADDPTGAPPLRRLDVLSHRRPLDVELMNAAASRLVGLHDFAAFCRRREGATTVRTLLRYSWRREHDGLITATVSADAFCHSMVRGLVGAVLSVGEGRRPVDWPAQVLAARRRNPALTVARALGLTLEAVDYPPDHLLAARAAESRATRTLDLPGC